MRVQLWTKLGLSPLPSTAPFWQIRAWLLPPLRLYSRGGTKTLGEIMGRWDLSPASKRSISHPNPQSEEPCSLLDLGCLLTHSLPEGDREGSLVPLDTTERLQAEIKSGLGPRNGSGSHSITGSPRSHLPICNAGAWADGLCGPSRMLILDPALLGQLELRSSSCAPIGGARETKEPGKAREAPQGCSDQGFASQIRGGLGVPGPRASAPQSEQEWAGAGDMGGREY